MSVRHFGKQSLSGLLLLLLLVSASAMAGEKLRLLGMFNDKAVLMVAGQRRLLGVGEVSPEGVRVESIEDRLVTVVWGGQYHQLLMGMGAAAYKPPQVSEVSVLPDSLGMYFVAGRINERKVMFLVDTGATTIALSSRMAIRLGLNFIDKGRATKVATASGVANAWELTLRKVQVGSITLGNVQAVVLEGDFPREILLGNSFLQQVEMVREGRLMKLRKKW